MKNVVAMMVIAATSLTFACGAQMKSDEMNASTTKDIVDGSSKTQVFRGTIMKMGAFDGKPVASYALMNFSDAPGSLPTVSVYIDAHTNGLNDLAARASELSVDTVVEGELTVRPGVSKAILVATKIKTYARQWWAPNKSECQVAQAQLDAEFFVPGSVPASNESSVTTAHDGDCAVKIGFGSMQDLHAARAKRVSLGFDKDFVGPLTRADGSKSYVRILYIVSGGAIFQ